MKVIEYDKLNALIDKLGFWAVDCNIKFEPEAMLELLTALLPYIEKEVPDEQ